MQKVKRFIQKLEDHRLLVAIIFTLAFIAIHIPLIFVHEPWSDETNPWAIAQKIDVTNAYELKFADPHSLAWEMILSPFAHLGMPEITMHFISLTIVALAVFLLMYKSPFHLVTRILFSCSAIFFYFNPVVSRDYCLIPLAVTLVACAYRKRFKHPVKYGLALAALLQSHFLMAGLAGIMTFIFFVQYLVRKDRLKLKIKPLIASLAIIAASLASLMPMVVTTFMDHAVVSDTTTAEQSELELAELPPKKNVVEEINRSLYGFDFPVLMIVIVLLSITLLVENHTVLIYFVTHLAFCLVTMTMIYENYSHFTQKSSIILIGVLLALWLMRAEEDSAREKSYTVQKILEKSELFKVIEIIFSGRIKYLYMFAIVLTIPYTAAAAVRDISEPYDYGVAFTEALEQFEDDAVFVVGDDSSYWYSYGPAVLLSGNRKIYSIVYQEYMSIGRYKKSDNDLLMKEHPDQEIADGIAEICKDHDHVYFLSTRFDIEEKYLKDMETRHDKLLQKMELVDTVHLKGYAAMDLEDQGDLQVEIYKTCK